MNEANAKRMVDFGDEYFESLKGKPISEEVKPVENTHVEGQMDEWHTVKYEGCTLSYYRVVPEKRNILSTLKITTPKIQAPFGIHVGVAKSVVLDALGKPTESKGSEISYECGDPYSQSVSFKFSKGVVNQITWESDIE